MTRTTALPAARPTPPAHRAAPPADRAAPSTVTRDEAPPTLPAEPAVASATHPRVVHPQEDGSAARAPTAATFLPARGERRLCRNDRARLTRALDAATTKRFPSEAERRVVLRHLAALPAADCREVLADPGRLERILDTIDDDDRPLLLDVLVRKGVVDAQPAAPVSTTSPRAPRPPAAPALLRDDPTSAPALRRAVLEENLARVAHYQAHFAAYRDAYRDAVAAADDVGALRDLGPLVPSALPRDLPGVPLASDAQRLYRDARGRAEHDPATMQAVADRLRRLGGRAIAGMSLTGEGEAALVLGENDGARIDVGGKVEASVAPDGTVDHHVVGAGKAALGPVAAGVEHGHVGVEVAIHGTGIAVRDEQLALKVHVGALDGKASFGGDRMSFDIAVEHEIAWFAGAAVRFGAAGRIGLQGVTVDDLAGFASTRAVGFFDTPPELGRGRSWSSLPVVVRADYERLGWTAEEWTKKADLARPVPRAG
jgi:hypothetical protein